MAEVPKLFRVTLQVSDLDKAANFYSKLLDAKGRRIHGARHYFDCGAVILALVDPAGGGEKSKPHPDYIYFLTRFGLVQAGMLEDRPGIPPSPQHLAQLIRLMKEERVRIILVQPWNDLKLAQRVAEDAGAKAIVVPTMVGGVKGVDTYIGTIDYNVGVLAQALR